MAIVVSRLAYPLLRENLAANAVSLVPARQWKDTAISLPSHTDFDWVNVLTGKRLRHTEQTRLALAALLDELPCAILAPV